MALINVHPEIKKRYLVLLHSTILIVKFTLIDQLVKWWMIGFLPKQPGYICKISSFFDLVYSWNYGISFGMLSQYHQYSNKILLWVNIAITMFLWWLLVSCKTFRSFLGYSFIVGGAIGNLYDRVFRGAVFDFLSFHWNDFYFAAFNIADSFIFIGVVMLIRDYYIIRKNIAKENEALYDETAIEAERIRKLDAEIAEKGIEE